MNGIGRTLAGFLAGLTLLGCVGCSGQSMSIQSNLPSHSSAAPAVETKPYQPGKKGELPGTKNGYLVQEPMGETVRADLDGDGKRETLTIATKVLQQKDGQSQWKETVLSSVKINGKEFLKKSDREGSSLNVPNVVLYTPESEHYFLADLNAKDGKLEIGLLDYGPSYDLTTTYLRYEKGHLISLGTVPGFPDQDSSSLDGKGNVTTPGRLSLLQNWQAPFVYQLKGDVLEKAPQAWYTPIDQPERPSLLCAARTGSRGLSVHGQQALGPGAAGRRHGGMVLYGGQRDHCVRQPEIHRDGSVRQPEYDRLRENDVLRHVVFLR